MAVTSPRCSASAAAKAGAKCSGLIAAKGCVAKGVVHSARTGLSRSAGEAESCVICGLLALRAGLAGLDRGDHIVDIAARNEDLPDVADRFNQGRAPHELAERLDRAERRDPDRRRGVRRRLRWRLGGGKSARARRHGRLCAAGYLLPHRHRRNGRLHPQRHARRAFHAARLSRAAAARTRRALSFSKPLDACCVKNSRAPRIFLARGAESTYFMVAQIRTCLWPCVGRWASGQEAGQPPGVRSPRRRVEQTRCLETQTLRSLAAPNT